MQPLQRLKADLRNIADPEKAKILSGFFKTGKGQYGESDIFLGIMVPQQRRIAKEYGLLSMKESRPSFQAKSMNTGLLPCLLWSRDIGKPANGKENA